MRRNRAIEAAPRNGGKACQEKDKEAGRRANNQLLFPFLSAFSVCQEVNYCNTMPCDGACVDGNWSSWSAAKLRFSCLIVGLVIAFTFRRPGASVVPTAAVDSRSVAGLWQRCPRPAGPCRCA